MVLLVSALAPTAGGITGKRAETNSRVDGAGATTWRVNRTRGVVYKGGRSDGCVAKADGIE